MYIRRVIHYMYVHVHVDQLHVRVDLHIHTVCCRIASNFYLSGWSRIAYWYQQSEVWAKQLLVLKRPYYDVANAKINKPVRVIARSSKQVQLLDLHVFQLFTHTKC